MADPTIDATIAGMSSPRRARAVASAVILALVVAACDGRTSPPPSSAPAVPSASPASPSPSRSADAGPTASADLSAVYEEINAQVQELRGLEELEPVVPQILSPQELSEVLREQVEEDSPPELLAAYERLYKAMNLMPRDQSLADVYVDLLESQVAGLYVPSDKRLYVVSKEGDVGAVERVFYAHEYEHALQDQHFDLGALQSDDLIGDSDRQLARQAMIEGDAYVVMTQWLQQHLSPAELLEVLAASNDPEAIAALEDIPPIVSNQILFPATGGLFWAFAIQAQGGWEAVDAAFADPPDSTEQILHQDKWASREPPIEVTLSADLAARLGDGWSVTLEDNLGEYQLGVWLTGSVPTGGLPPAPPAAAAGWGGDRLLFVEGPDDAFAVVVKTVWDSNADAVEFHDAIAELSSDWPSGSIVSPSGTNEVWVVIASDTAVTTEVEARLGLAGV